MKSILITGTNRGIGLEFVRQYLAQDYFVFACCRDPESAKSLLEMACDQLQVLPLDVSNDDSIQALPDYLKQQKLSIFINNAGTYGQGQTMALADSEEWLRVFHVNTIAPLLLTRAILPLMDRNAPGKLAYLSSKMGSIADNTGGSMYIYRSSKSALNQVVKSLSVDLQHEGLLVTALHPGWVKTDMGGDNALIDTATSVQGMMQVIDQLDAPGSGHFFNFDGQEIPW